MSRCGDATSPISAARAILVRPTGLRPYIHDCTFHDNRNGGGNHNAHEAISLGYDNPSSGVSMRAHVVANRLWTLNIEGEGICVKTSDNIIERNEIVLSRGAFTNRYGERNLFIEKYHHEFSWVRHWGSGKQAHRQYSQWKEARSEYVAAMLVRASRRTARIYRRLIPTWRAISDRWWSATTTMARALPAVNTFVESHNGVIRLMRQVGIRLPRRVS